MSPRGPFHYGYRLLGIPVVLAFIIAASPACFGQNLVPNPSFETYTECPTMVGNGNLECTPWISVAGTADYFHRCGPPGIVGVPSNFQGNQEANTGDAYTGIYFRIDGSFYREYVQVQLDQVLEQDSCYQVSFYYSLADETCGINHIGALLTPDAVTNPVGQTPQLNWSGQFYDEKDAWVHVVDYITAVGNEAYITIGNFYSDAQSPFDPFCSEEFFFLSYYYIEDVVVTKVPIQSFTFDLGGPVTACDEYTIDPMMPEVNFYWSNGSVGPTLTVTESGTYSVTATFGCTMEEAEIEVTIVESEGFDVGLAAMLLCEGETFTVELDPFLGEYEWQDGSNDTEYTISEPGLYHVTLTSECEPLSDTINVSYMSPPTPFALGNDTFLCTGDVIYFMLDPDAGEYEWQDNTTSSNYDISQAGSYALTISNMCGEEVDALEVIEIVDPSIYLGEDDVLCFGDEIEFEFDPDMGTFTWQDGTMDNSYTITEAGFYNLTVSNECATVTEDLVITAGNYPINDLPSNASACEGESIVLNTGNTADEITWSDGSTGPSITVTSPGIYSVTITNDCGEEIGETEVVFFSAIAPPDLGPDFTICPGETVVIDVATLDASYIWSDATTGSTIDISSAGTYAVTVYNGCSSFADTVVVTQNNNPPSFQFPNDFAICQGESVTIDPGVGGVTYQWSDGSSNSTLTTNTAGVYTLTISNSCGTDADTIVLLNGGVAPVVSLGIDTTLCNGSTITLTPVFSNVNSWLWQDGSTLPTFTASEAGSYIVNGFNACGDDSDTITISTLPDVPMLDLGPDVSLCPGETIPIVIVEPNVSITWPDGSTTSQYIINTGGMINASIANACGIDYDTLIATLLPAIPDLNLGPDQTFCPGDVLTFDPQVDDVSYVWHDGSTNPTYTTTIGGIVSLTIANACGSSIDTVEITESNQGPQVDLGPDIIACEGEDVTIHAGVLGVSYVWQDGSMDNTLTVNSTGIYSITVSNSCGTDSDTIAVNILGTSPVVELGPDISDCKGAKVTLHINQPGATYAWNDGSTLDSLVVVASGMYTVTATNLCGADSDTVQVSLEGVAPLVALGPDTIVCEGVAVLLSALPESEVNYSWQDGTQGNSILGTQAGSYILSASNACGETKDTLLITYRFAPAPFTLGADTSICPGSAVTLNAPVNTGTTVMWQDGSTANTYIADQAGTYTLDISNDCGTTTDALSVIIDQTIPLLSLPSKLEWCEGDEFTLDATQNFSAHYLWSTGESSPIITVATPGIYSVEVTAPCATITDETSVDQRALCDSAVTTIFVPNVFSPNGDQVNDVFTVSFHPDMMILGVTGSIYDRWGNLLFQSAQHPFSWDGTRNGQLVQPGVYVYKFKFAYRVGSRDVVEQVSGDVTVIR
jgi:gliding motility-associated-like protein